MAAVETPPVPLFVNDTPSGTRIEFFNEPRRYYTVNGKEVPSVTTILDALFKDLSWWGMEIGVKGVHGLWEKGLINRAHPSGQLAVMHPDENVWTVATPELLIEQLKLQKLTTSNVVEKAGSRGTAAHDALEAWAVTRELPSAENFPPEQQPYIRAVREFCMTMGDAWTTDAIEVVVGSDTNSFAGRYDLRGFVTNDVLVSTQAVRARGDAPLQPQNRKTTVIEAGTKLLLDLKTSKGIYPSHLIQLAAYEWAGRECGYDPTDRRFVLHATMHGVYEMQESKAELTDFLAVLETYGVLQRCKEMLARG